VLTRVRRKVAAVIAPPAAPPRKPAARKVAAASKPSSAPRPAKDPVAQSMEGINKYAEPLSATAVDRGVHRNFVGGMWDEIGTLQFDYLVAQGLQPGHRLLDVGCGAMRGGIHFAKYLEPSHYYGVDVNESLIQAALTHELPQAGFADRVPAANLRVTDSFDSDFGVQFDYAIAVSLFTHLPLNYIKLCLFQVAKVMPPGGRFFVTYFVAPPELAYDEPLKQVVATTHSQRDPFHYRVEEMQWAAGVAGWEFRNIGDWDHPRGQQMMEFRRTG
jgi:SAM-dependent methyltransferase